MRYWLFAFALVCTTTFGQEKVPLSQLKINSVEFSDSDLPSVLDFLGAKAKEMNGQPANFVLYDPVGTLAAADPKINLKLQNVPFSVVIRYVAQLSETSFLKDNNVVWIGNPEEISVLKKRRQTRTSVTLAKPAFRRLARIRVPDIDFSETTLTEAVEGLRQLDRMKKGTGNFILIAGETISPDDVKINMKVSGLNLAELTQFTSELSGFTIRVDSNTIVFRAPDARPNPAVRSSRVLTYLNRKVVGQVSLNETTIPEVIDFIRYHSKTAAVPNGINILKLTDSEKNVTLDLKNARLSDILRYANEQTGTTFRIDQSSIQIVDLPPPPPAKEE